MKKKLKKTNLAESESLQILGSKWDFSQVGKSFIIPYKKPKK